MLNKYTFGEVWHLGLERFFIS